MTRRECEAKLLELAAQAMALLKEYDPNADILTINSSHGQTSVTALYVDTDIEAVDYSDVLGTYSIYTTRFPDGETWDGQRWARARACSKEWREALT